MRRFQEDEQKVGDDNKKIEQVASISANNDHEIGKPSPTRWPR